MAKPVERLSRAAGREAHLQRFVPPEVLIAVKVAIVSTRIYEALRPAGSPG